MTEPSKMIPLDSAEDLAQLIDLWHSTQVATLEHLMKIPEGAKFTTGNTEHVLAGDTLKGFRAGITTALMLLGKLPYGELEDDAQAAGT